MGSSPHTPFPDHGFAHGFMPTLRPICVRPDDMNTLHFVHEKSVRCVEFLKLCGNPVPSLYWSAVSPNISLTLDQRFVFDSQP